MGREFRNFVCSTQKQRSFLKDDLLKLLSRYQNAMGPELTERKVTERIKDTLINNPDMPRREALMSLQVKSKLEKEKQ